MPNVMVAIPNGISIGSAVFAQLTIVADRTTDRQTNKTDGRCYSICNNRPHLHSTVMRPKTPSDRQLADLEAE